MTINDLKDWDVVLLTGDRRAVKFGDKLIQDYKNVYDLKDLVFSKENTSYTVDSCVAVIVFRDNVTVWSKSYKEPDDEVKERTWWDTADGELVYICEAKPGITPLQVITYPVQMNAKIAIIPKRKLLRPAVITPLTVTEVCSRIPLGLGLST